MSEQKINFIRQFNRVSDLFAEDERMSPWHISMYFALFHCWNLSKFRNPISINRSDLMNLSKIGSVNTYTRCLKELDQWGYINYIPSKNPQRGSKVHMYRFDTCPDTSLDTCSDTSPDTCPDNSPVHHLIHLLRPSINNINNNKPIKHLNKIEVDSSIDQPPKSKSLKSSSSGAEGSSSGAERQSSRVKRQSSGAEGSSSGAERQSSRVKRQSSGAEGSSSGAEMPPSLDQVKTFFQEKNKTNLEAEKFFNYFESNGWLVGGKTKMKDWQAAARNWILRARTYAEKADPTFQRLHVNQNTRYDEPL